MSAVTVSYHRDAVFTSSVLNMNGIYPAQCFTQAGSAPTHTCGLPPTEQTTIEVDDQYSALLNLTGGGFISDSIQSKQRTSSQLIRAVLVRGSLILISQVETCNLTVIIFNPIEFS